MSFSYGKVLLYAYPKLEKFAEASEAAVENKAMLSFLRRGSTVSLAEEMIEEIALSRILRTLKDEMDELLPCFSREELFLLEYKYFRRKARIEEFADARFQGSERSYFRRQNALLKKVNELFLRKGWTEEWFLEQFSDYAPFMRALKAVKAGKDRTAGRRTQNSFSSRKSSGCFLPRTTNSTTASTPIHRATRKKICTPSSGSFSVTGGSSTFPEASVK